jgi:hypothetical protein
LLAIVAATALAVARRAAAFGARLACAALLARAAAGEATAVGQQEHTDSHGGGTGQDQSLVQVGILVRLRKDKRTHIIQTVTIRREKEGFE